MTHSLPTRVRIVEVGPRDGLQNEPAPLRTEDKVRLVDGLADAGLRYIETGSFVSPRWVPQMADSEEVFAGIARRDGVTYAALTPNLRGLERAMAAGASEVAVFAAASEAFSQRNINCSVAESIERFRPVVDEAGRAGIPVRGYVSCVLGCPYDGHVEPREVLRVSDRLLELGCYEISLGDTIGIGTAGDLSRLLETLLGAIPVDRLALAATEDVVYLLDGLGIHSGVDLDALIAVGANCCATLGRQTRSRVARARAGAGENAGD